MILPVLLLNLLLAASTPAEVLIVHLPLKGKTTLSMGPKGSAVVERIGSVTWTSIRLDGIQAPQKALEGMNAYVAWAVSPEGSFDNLGELDIVGSKASLDATTSFDRFGILITAEPHYLVDKPSFAIMFKNDAARSVRSVPLVVQVGEFEYPRLPLGSSDTPRLVLEARAAVAIAASAQAEKLAEADFRQASVSLATLEELARRPTSSPDVVAASAHEVIRRAQRAFALARQNTQSVR